MPTAVIIGAGIAGLTSALALRQQRWEVRVYEQATELTAVGSGLALAPNALRALDVIGLGDAIRRLAVHGDVAGGIRDQHGTWLAKTQMRGIIATFDDPVVLLPRHQLIAALAQPLTAQQLRLGSRVDTIDYRTGTLSTSDGEITADLIVGADGIHSAARAAIFPAHAETVYSGQTTWRTVVADSSIPAPACEYWGPGALAAGMPLTDGKVYFYAAEKTASGGRATDPRQELAAKFAAWARPIPELIAASDPQSISRRDVHVLKNPLPTFHRGKAALIGDAAHPMTPNLGQGACQAIEDAIVLAHEVAHQDGLSGYSQERVPRTNQIVRRSAGAATLAMLRRAPAIAARNVAMRTVARIAPGAAAKQATTIFGWQPPTTPAAGQRRV